MVTKTAFDQQYSKNSNIVMYYFSILLSVYTVAHWEVIHLYTKI